MGDVYGLAYQVQEIYRTKRPVGEAILFIKERNKSVSLDMIWAMWLAIDAYDYHNKDIVQDDEEEEKNP